ncbi:FimV/HubP family polar landmark protein [Pseudoalteromonas lipolytica]
MMILLLDNEFTEADAFEPESDSAELENKVTVDDPLPELDDLQEFELEEAELESVADNAQTLADIESTLADSDGIGELSDDEIDDDFMADLTQTDFDALLNELAEPDETDITDASEFDVDFNALLNEDLQVEAADESDFSTDIEPSDEQASKQTDDEFVDIDSLLEQSDDEALDFEPYDDVDMDVGLSDFNDLLAGDNPTDVDAESGGYSAKLDLARAYIEIDDFDSALEAIEDVIANGPEEVQEEALSLKAKIKS